MAYNRRSSLARYLGLAALSTFIFGICLSAAYAGPAEPHAAAKDATEVHSVSEPLTDFEKMELHYRRYSTAANHMAELVQQLNQKIQDVSLAGKTVEEKNNSHNRRLLEEKLRQLENTRISVSRQYAQLHAQMQNEYRSYTALSSDLKAKHNPVSDSNPTTETATDIKTSPGKKDPKAKDAKTKNAKAKDSANEPKIKEPQAADLPANDPQILDLDTVELRARRDAAKN